LDKNQTNPDLFLFITMFQARMRFSSVPETWLARKARNGGLETSVDATGKVEP